MMVTGGRGGEEIRLLCFTGAFVGYGWLCAGRDTLFYIEFGIFYYFVYKVTDTGDGAVASRLET